MDTRTVGQTDLTHPVMNEQRDWADLKIYYAAGVDAAPGARDRTAHRSEHRC